MSLSGLATLVTSDPVLSDALESARTAPARLATLDVTGPPALRPFLVAGLVARWARAHRAGRDRDPAGGRGAGRGGGRPARPHQVALYPAWETLPHERLSPAVRHRRAPARGAAPAGAPGRGGHCHRSAAGGRGAGALGAAAPGERAGRHRAGTPGSRRRGRPRGRGAPARGAAYQRVDLVERRGEFAVRGGIVDVFPPTEEHPVRVEFWGDTVEDIRSFSVADQRSLEPVAELWAPPCRELLLTDDVRAPGRASWPRSTRRWPRCSTRLADGHAVEGMESLAPALVDSMELLTELLPDGIPRPGVRPREGARSRPRPGRHQRGVPPRLLGGGGHRCRGTGRPRCQRLPVAGRRPGRGHRRRAAVVEHLAVRPRPDRHRR